MKNMDSPLARLQHRLGEFPEHSAFSICEKAFLSHLNIRGDARSDEFRAAVYSVLDMDLPAAANTWTEKGGVRAAWLGPDEWLLTGSGLEDRMSVLEGALFGIHSSLNDLSGGQTIINLAGCRAVDVMSKGTTLDVHPAAFRPGQCAQTIMAHTNIALLAAEDRGQQVYDVVVRRSFADHLCGWLLDCAHEYVQD